LNENIWKSFKSENFNRAISKTCGEISRKLLNKEQIDEYDLLKSLSEKFIIDKYDRNPTFRVILKTKIGYTITRNCILKCKPFCKWNIYMNIDTNEAILTCDKECNHENRLKKRQGSFLFINFLQTYSEFILSLVTNYETIKTLRSTKSFDNEIWSNFKISVLIQNELNKKQKLEYSKLREYSEYLMKNNFNNIKTTLKEIRKSSNGYIIYRCNSNNKFIINLHLITNQIEIKRSI
jgi:hypothetical protein